MRYHHLNKEVKLNTHICRTNYDVISQINGEEEIYKKKGRKKENEMGFWKNATTLDLMIQEYYTSLWKKTNKQTSKHANAPHQSCPPIQYA